MDDIGKKNEEEFFKSEIEKLKDKINEYDLTSISDQILKRVKKKIIIDPVPTSEDKIKMGESKIGGNPDLPDGVSWPSFNGIPLAFLMQLNLSELKKLEFNQFFTDNGLILFFYNERSTGWSVNEKDSWKVIFTKDLENLVRTEFPKNVGNIKDSSDQSFSYDSHKLIFNNAISLPPAGREYGGYWDEDNTYQDPEFIFDDNFEEFLEEETDAHDENGISLFGYPTGFECDSHKLSCYLLSNGRDAFEFDKVLDDEKMEELKILESEAEEWTLLLQIWSDDDVGWLWDDWGCLYFWIRKEDLKNNNFNHIWMLMEQG